MISARPDEFELSLATCRGNASLLREIAGRFSGCDSFCLESPGDSTLSGVDAVLEMLRSGEKCACMLLDELQISQSTLSHHMKILCDSGIVQGRKEGKWVHYSIDPAGAERAGKLLNTQITLTDSTDSDMENVCCCMEGK